MRLLILTALILNSCAGRSVKNDSPDTGSDLAEISLNSKSILEKILKDSDKTGEQFLKDVDFKLSISVSDKNSKEKKPTCKGETKDLAIPSGAGSGSAKTAIVTQECTYNGVFSIIRKKDSKQIVSTKDSKQEFTPPKGEKLFNWIVKVCANAIDGNIDERLKPELKTCVDVPLNPKGEADITIDVSFGDENGNKGSGNSLTDAQAAVAKVIEVMAKIKQTPEYLSKTVELTHFTRIEGMLPKWKVTFESFAKKEPCQDSHKKLLTQSNFDWLKVFAGAKLEMSNYVKVKEPLVGELKTGLDKLLLGINSVSKEYCKI